MQHPLIQTDFKTNKMLVNVILDRSGSMGNCRQETIDGYNEYIKGLRADQASEYFVTLIQFDTEGSSAAPSLTISYVDKPLADVPLLDKSTYEPRGMTPLYDAIGECVRRVQANGRAVTTVIITDGQNNSSVEFTLDQIKALRKEKEAEGWTFVFIGAEIDAYAAGGAMGMATGNTVSYSKTMTSQMFAATAGATMARSHNNMARGVRASSLTSFYDVGQKSAMGDPTVAPAATVTPDGTTAGGGPAASGSFRKRRWKANKVPVA